MLTGGREIEFIRKLGSGGFGEVFLANLHGRDRFVRRVAVKLLKKDEQNDDIAKRQKDEARLLGMLAHDNIVQVLELTEIDGQPAVVMEYVQGIDLSGILEETTVIPLRAALEIGRATASALEAAWNSPSPLENRPLRVIHRDIKPANILLTGAGGVKVLDFGIARGDFQRDYETQSAVWGTLRYMPPELSLEQGAASPKQDTYALGLTLLDMINGLRTDRPPLGERPYERYFEGCFRGIPEDVKAVLQRMLAYDPAARPSHRESIRMLEELLGSSRGETLNSFASRVIPPLLQKRQQESVPLAQSRSTLDAMTLRPAPQTRRPWALLAFMTGGVALGLGILGLSAGGLYFFRKDLGGWWTRLSHVDFSEENPLVVVKGHVDANATMSVETGNSFEEFGPPPEAAYAYFGPLYGQIPSAEERAQKKADLLKGEPKKPVEDPRKGTTAPPNPTPAPVETVVAVAPPPAIIEKTNTHKVKTVFSVREWTATVDGKPVKKGEIVELTEGTHLWVFTPPASYASSPEYADIKSVSCPFFVMRDTLVDAHIDVNNHMSRCSQSDL